jgi:hypothetical protein
MRRGGHHAPLPPIETLGRHGVPSSSTSPYSDRSLTVPLAPGACAVVEGLSGWWFPDFGNRRPAVLGATEAPYPPGA